MGGRVRAPELPATATWVNTAAPLSLRPLRGRVVLLDFWTYSCINCLHVLDDLKYLQAQYGDRLVIIGVHTPKFDHERTPQALQQATARYGITYPVVADSQGYLWDQYAIKAWPSFVVIDPQGYVVATRVGEGQRASLETLIQSLLSGGGFSADRTDAAVDKAPFQSPLAFPGKVLADAASDTLFIADTGHHRLVMTTLAGQLKAVIGTGQPGWQDGPWDQAQFCSPQGLAWDAQQQVLILADTGNHLIRQIDWAHPAVTTLAGTGQQSRQWAPHGGDARAVALSSPWDLVQRQDQIYVAMAGSHQIWQLDRTRTTVQTLVGTGAEFCVDGSPTVAAFAQPSGMTWSGEALYVADSETSSIRRVTLTVPQVSTVCGAGQLFEFGDQDGVGDRVRLQHCLGIAARGNWLWVADTYNHKIKAIDLATGACRTLCGDGVAGWQDGSSGARFFEPSGLSAVPDALYVADTNNHCIRRVDLATLAVTTLQIPQLCPPGSCWPTP